MNYNCKMLASLRNAVARYRYYNRTIVPRSGIKTDKQVLSRKHVNRRLDLQNWKMNARWKQLIESYFSNCL